MQVTQALRELATQFCHWCLQRKAIYSFILRVCCKLNLICISLQKSQVVSPFSPKISRKIFNFTPFTMARIEPRTCFIILRLHISAFEFLSEFIVAIRSWVFVHFECTHSRQTSGCLNAAICWVSSMETFKMQRLQHNARQLESREAQLHYVNMISLESFPLVNVGHPESFTFRLLYNEKTRSSLPEWQFEGDLTEYPSALEQPLTTPVF